MVNPAVRINVGLKSIGAAYLWWFFLGGTGAQKFYLGRPVMGTLYLCTLGLLGFGLVWDLFTLPAQVRRANRRLVAEAGGLAGEQDGPAIKDIDFSKYKSRGADVHAALAPRLRPILPAQPASFGRRA